MNMFHTKENHHTLSQKNHLSICHANLFYPAPPAPPLPPSPHSPTQTLFKDSVYKYNYFVTAGNRHKKNSRFCKEIREDNFLFWWRRVHEDASQGMYMSKIEIFFLLLEYSKIRECYAVANALTIRNMYSLFLYVKRNSRKINRPTKNMTKIVTLLHF